MLQYFLVVAQEGTISAAANRLHITQPTLSRQLGELEEELGTKLFHRGNRKIALTEEGHLLRKRAKEISELVHKTYDELHLSDGTVEGDVYIGGGETHGMLLLANTIKDLQKKYPQIRYHLFSGNADDVKERLDKGLLDFGILIEPVDIGKYESIQLPATDVWGVLMRKDSPLSSQSTIAPKDLWDLPLLISRQRIASEAMEKWLKKPYEEMHLVATYNLLYNASLMVEAGIGYALCLDRLINTTGNSNLCFRPLAPKMEVNLDVVWKKDQVFSRAATIFKKQLSKNIHSAKP